MDIYDEAERSRLPGRRNGPADAYRHVIGAARLGFLAILAIVIGFVAPAAPAEPEFEKWTVVPLQNGINHIDLNGDGVQDMVIKSWRENFNAHHYSVYDFFVNLTDGNGKVLQLNLVPFTDGTAGFRHDVRTVQGADCILNEIRLVRDAGRMEFPLIVVHGKRTLKESYYENEMVTFFVYELKYNNEGIPGLPTFYFERHGVIEGKEKYCDINGAFKKELGLE